MTLRKRIDRLDRGNGCTREADTYLSRLAGIIHTGGPEGAAMLAAIRRGDYNAARVHLPSASREYALTTLALKHDGGTDGY